MLRVVILAVVAALVIIGCDGDDAATIAKSDFSHSGGPPVICVHYLSSSSTNEVVSGDKCWEAMPMPVHVALAHGRDPASLISLDDVSGQFIIRVSAKDKNGLRSVRINDLIHNSHMSHHGGSDDYTCPGPLDEHDELLPDDSLGKLVKAEVSESGVLQWGELCSNAPTHGTGKTYWEYGIIVEASNFAKDYNRVELVFVSPDLSRAGARSLNHLPGHAISAPLFVGIGTDPDYHCRGKGTTLTWRAYSSYLCVNSWRDPPSKKDDSWTGDKPPKGSADVTCPPGQDCVYYILCKGPAGLAGNEAFLKARPDLTLSFSAHPRCLGHGKTSELKWAATDFTIDTTCTASGGSGDWAGTEIRTKLDPKGSTLEGSKVVSPTETTAYGLKCECGQKKDVTISVGDDGALDFTQHVADKNILVELTDRDLDYIPPLAAFNLSDDKQPWEALQLMHKAPPLYAYSLKTRCGGAPDLKKDDILRVETGDVIRVRYDDMLTESCWPALVHRKAAIGKPLCTKGGPCDSVTCGIDQISYDRKWTCGPCGDTCTSTLPNVRLCTADDIGSEQRGAECGYAKGDACTGDESDNDCGPGLWCDIGTLTCMRSCDLIDGWCWPAGSLKDIVKWSGIAKAQWPGKQKPGEAAHDDLEALGCATAYRRPGEPPPTP